MIALGLWGRSVMLVVVRVICGLPKELMVIIHKELSIVNLIKINALLVVVIETHLL